MKLRYHFSRQRRQLRHLAKTIARAHATGLSVTERQLSRMRSLTKALAPKLGRAGLTRALGTCGLALGLAFSAQAQNQFNFRMPVDLPGNVDNSVIDASDYARPTLADIDGDGDLDLLTGLYEDESYEALPSLTLFRNDGSATSPSFAAAEINPFGFELTVPYLEGPRFVDLDGDGDLDLAYTTGEYDENGSILTNLYVYQLNVGTTTNPSFGPVTTLPNVVEPESDVTLVQELVFGDIDGDGDMDILSAGIVRTGPGDEDYEVSTIFYENTTEGSDINFNAGVANNFGLTFDLEEYDIPRVLQLVDIDGDGDLDVFGNIINFVDDPDDEYESDVSTRLFYALNEGTTSAPAFSAAVTDGLIGTVILDEYEVYPTLGDLDDDGDLDLIVFEDGVGARYYQNDGAVSVTDVTTRLDVQLSPNPTTGIINISNVRDIARVEVVDAQGRIILSREDAVPRLDLSSLPTGVYVVKLITDSGRFDARKVQLR